MTHITPPYCAPSCIKQFHLPKMHFEKIPGYIMTHLRCLSPPVHCILSPIKLPTPQTDSRDVQIRPWQSDTLSSHVGEVKVKAIFVK